jgi:hypothetical protein
MDGRRFDRMTRALFLDVSRRGAVGALVAGVTAAGATMLAWRGGAAQVDPEATDPVCEGRSAINNRNCVNQAFQCTRDRRCFCAKTVNDNKRCVRARNFSCPRRDECDRNRDCPANNVCVRVGGCCRGGRQKCLRLCS